MIKSEGSSSWCISMYNPNPKPLAPPCGMNRTFQAALLLTFCHIRQAGNRGPIQSLEVPWVPQFYPKKIKRKEWMKTYTHIQERRPLNEILTSVLPLKSCTGSSLPAEKAKVQRAHADLSSNPARSLYRPTTKQGTWLQTLDSSLHFFMQQFI